MATKVTRPLISRTIQTVGILPRTPSTIRFHSISTIRNTKPAPLLYQRPLLSNVQSYFFNHRKIQNMPLVGLLALIGAAEVLTTMATPREPVRRPPPKSKVTINQSVQEGLKKDGIIPDVISDFTPTTLVQIKYPCGKEVSLGSNLKPTETQDEPEIQLMPDDGENNATYTLVLTDPDAPSREDPKWSEFCHWIITDIKAPTPEAVAAAVDEVGTFVNKQQGRTIVEYMGPAPPPKTGKHRYVFLLYKNGSKSPTEGPKERKLWGNDTPRTGVQQWAEKNGLTLIGANYFFARNDVQ